jgi:hypothetical protein
MRIKKLMVVFVVAVLIAVGVVGPASAKNNAVIQDGLVNVAIGDVTILENVQIADAVDLVVQACGIDATVVVGVISAIDAGNTKQYTFCKVEEGQVRVTQNK